MGEAQTPHFYDFGILNRHQAPTPSLFIFGDTRTPQKNQEKSLGNLKNSISINANIWETQSFDIVRKDGHRKMMKIRLIKSPKSWI